MKEIHAEARYFPSGLNLTELTALEWPRKRYRRRYCLSSGSRSKESSSAGDCVFDGSVCGISGAVAGAEGAGCSSLIRLFGDSIINRVQGKILQDFSNLAARSSSGQKMGNSSLSEVKFRLNFIRVGFLFTTISIAPLKNLPLRQYFMYFRPPAPSPSPFPHLLTSF